MTTIARLTIPLLTSISFLACAGDVDTADTDNDSMHAAAPDSVNMHGAVTIDTASPSTAAASSDLRKIDLNAATDAELRTVPGVGDKMVHEIEEYRPYKSIIQFRKQIGKYVDAATVAEYEKYAFVPIDPNASDAATMQQIPGLDVATADQLIAARPYTSVEAFLEKVRTLASPALAQTAAMYIETKQTMRSE